MIKRFSALLTAVLIAFSVVSVSASAASGSSVANPVHDFSYDGNDIKQSLLSGKYYKTNNAYYKDEAQIFDSDSDYGKLCENIQATADEIGMNVAVFIGGNYRSDPETEEFTRNGIIELFTLEYDQNSVFLYLDFEGQSSSYDYICTCHDAKLYYPSSGFDDRVEEMIQDMYKYLPSSGSKIYKSKVKTAIETFTYDLGKYKRYGPAWECSYHNDEKGCYRYVFFGEIVDMPIPPPKYWPVFLGAGLLLGIVIGIYSNKKIRKQYKFRELQKASAYTSRNRIRFNEVTDQFLHEHTTRRYIPPSDSGSGGGGGGGGGGSFGGGGGHR